jgi:hypothetical protein
MQSLQVEGRADQAPLPDCCLLPSQRELPKAQHLLDDPDYRLDGRLVESVGRSAGLGPQL